MAFWIKKYDFSVCTSLASRMLQNFSLLIKENIFISKCHLVIFRYYSSFVTNRAENTEMNYEKEKSKELGAKKKLFFPKNLQVFFDKKIPMLAVVVTTIAIVILYLENG